MATIVRLTFRPTRTRNFSHTYMDFVNDMFVPRTKIEAVTYGEDAAAAVFQKLFDELKNDAGVYIAPPGATRHEGPMTPPHYQDFAEIALRDAIRTYDLWMGDAYDYEPPAEVFVLVKEQKYRAWGGTYYTMLEPHPQAYAKYVSANTNCYAGPRGLKVYTAVKMPLVGVEALTEAC